MQKGPILWDFLRWGKAPGTALLRMSTSPVSRVVMPCSCSAKSRPVLRVMAMSGGLAVSACAATWLALAAALGPWPRLTVLGGGAHDHVRAQRGADSSGRMMVARSV